MAGGRQKLGKAILDYQRFERAASFGQAGRVAVKMGVLHNHSPEIRLVDLGSRMVTGMGQIHNGESVKSDCT